MAVAGTLPINRRQHPSPAPLSSLAPPRVSDGTSRRLAPTSPFQPSGTLPLTQVSPLPADVIALDAVGTVIAPDPAVEVAYGRVARKHGSRLSDDEIAVRFRQILGHREAGESTSEAGEREFWRSVVAEVLPDTQAPVECFEELFAWFAEPTAWRLYPDVLPALEAWQACGHRVILASNFDSRLRRVWQGLVPDRHRLEFCISSEVGFRKPSPGFFAALCQQLQTPPARVVMVGDSWREDVLGAHAAGLHAAWICRRPTPLPAAAPSGVWQLSELPQLALTQRVARAAGGSAAVASPQPPPAAIPLGEAQS